ncbi:GspH/FimT family pseudopilin [Neptunicella sp. SCSIO 80796]|uniref:GspH/FimT family pseudopilin n=1 Tax=Neptunicella plasticusilytica TaxID=3117012 RepID=UPI003A4D4D58
MKKQYGLTLVELLITIAIVAILATVVAPNVRDMLITNRVVAQLNEVSAMIQYARSTAVNEQTTTIVCPSQDFSSCTTNWSNAKMVFIDANSDGDRNANEEILAGTEINESTLITTGPNAVIRFSSTGVTASPATILICHNSNEAKFARALTVSLQGRVKTSRDSNNDGIYEDNTGTALSCD